ncbi:MAG: hypothetical protein L3J67_09895 [Hyphomicrobiaceae bacterium]|nr:hypothetical protein [Hyphomicrobiaceae bacterium]
MAKARYHKAQRVFVKPVGTWGFIETIVPKWIKGIEEPIKISYDVGMGREFAQDELEAGETDIDAATSPIGVKSEDNRTWHVVRAQNKWKSSKECGHHPYPGTHPVVVTTERDWGGWRVPGAEYDRDPDLIERQARLLAKAPMIAALLYQFIEDVNEQEENLPESTVQIAALAQKVLAQID